MCGAPLTAMMPMMPTITRTASASSTAMPRTGKNINKEPSVQNRRTSVPADQSGKRTEEKLAESTR